jgi:phospholipid transport system substrate-binding protein
MASRVSFVLAASVILLTGLFGAPAYAAASTPTTVASENNAQRFVQELGDKAVAILGDKSSSPDEKNTIFKQLMRDSFDLTTIARFVIGRNAWQGASADEKEEYLHLFEKLVMKIYSDRFALYSGEGFKVTDTHTEGERDTIISSHIIRDENAPPVSVNWRVRNFDGRLAIIDVIVEGISMSVTQREEYSSVLTRNNNSLRPLLDLMMVSLEKQDKADAKAAGH